KPHGHERPDFARRVTEKLDKLDPDHTHMIQSLDRGLIEQITRLDAKRSTAFVVGFQIGDLPTTSTGAVVIEDWSFHRRMLAEAPKQGRQLYTWTVNDVGDLSDNLAGGVDAGITDGVGRAGETKARLGSGANACYLYPARGPIDGCGEERTIRHRTPTGEDARIAAAAARRDKYRRRQEPAAPAHRAARRAAHRFQHRRGRVSIQAVREPIGSVTLGLHCGDELIECALLRLR